MRRKAATFDDIARYTGYSKTTVSRYFNTPDTLTEHTRLKIQDALVTLDYKENKVARILANGRTECIGVLAPPLHQRYYANLLNALLNTYQKYGYKFIVLPSSDNPEIEKKYLREIMSYQIEGLIVMSRTTPSQQLRKYGAPVVAIEREDRFISSVNTNNYAGGEMAARLLLEDGCTRLYYINNPFGEETPAYHRMAAFEDICFRARAPHLSYLRTFGEDDAASRNSLDEIYRSIRWESGGQRVGIFAGNDMLANMLMNVILRDGHGIPEEFEIVGFDNSLTPEETILPITTVGQDIAAIADEAMRLLQTQQDACQRRGPVVAQHSVIEPRLIRRGTSRNCVK